MCFHWWFDDSTFFSQMKKCRQNKVNDNASSVFLGNFCPTASYQNLTFLVLTSRIQKSWSPYPLRMQIMQHTTLWQPAVSSKRTLDNSICVPQIVVPSQDVLCLFLYIRKIKKKDKYFFWNKYVLFGLIIRCTLYKLHTVFRNKLSGDS